MSETKPTQAKPNQPTLTKQQVIDGINQFIANNQGKNIADGIKDIVESSGATVITELFGVSSISSFYLQLATEHPTHETELKALARESNPYFINDTKKFMEYINRDWEHSRYNCNVFMQDGHNKAATPLAIPNGTITYLGARTHRGKTTAMVSMAADALNQGKTVYFYTNEETTEQIILRLIKARLFYNVCPDYMGTDDYIETLASMVPAGVNLNNEIIAALKKGNGTQLHKDIQQAFIDVSKDLHNHKLNIIDGLSQHTFDDIKTSLSLLNAGDVVLLDYIQHIRRPAEKTAQRELATASQDIADIAAKHDLVIIAGAQMNRDAENDDDDDDKPKQKGSVQKPDKLHEKYLREAGDLEQDANIIILIGHQPNPNPDKPPKRFYKITKQRNHAGDTHRYLIDDNATFSLYGCRVVGGMLEYFKPFEAEQADADNGKKQTPMFMKPKL